MVTAKSPPKCPPPSTGRSLGASDLLFPTTTSGWCWFIGSAVALVAGFTWFGVWVHGTETKHKAFREQRYEWLYAECRTAGRHNFECTKLVSAPGGCAFGRCR
jgi:hypothetical protein